MHALKEFQRSGALEKPDMEMTSKNEGFLAKIGHNDLV